MRPGWREQGTQTTRHHQTLTPLPADATSETVEAVAVTWRGWSLKRRRGQRMKQKGWSLARMRWSLEWEEVERSVDREAGTVS